MANVRRTAMGGLVDIDQLRLANEHTIAIGNAKTNARGDLLGSGGKVVKTRAQVMQDYHALNTQFATDDDMIYEHEGQVPTEVFEQQQSNVLQSAAQDIPIAENETTPSYTKPRGSFAEAVAEETEVTQELVEPTGLVGSNAPPKGIQRI